MKLFVFLAVLSFAIADPLDIRDKCDKVKGEELSSVMPNGIIPCLQATWYTPKFRQDFKSADTPKKLSDLFSHLCKTKMSAYNKCTDDYFQELKPCFDETEIFFLEFITKKAARVFHTVCADNAMQIANLIYGFDQCRPQFIANKDRLETCTENLLEALREKIQKNEMSPTIYNLIPSCEDVKISNKCIQQLSHTCKSPSFTHAIHTLFNSIAVCEKDKVLH